MQLKKHTIKPAIVNLIGRLLDARSPDGNWSGRLSSSALSTAVAVFALAKADRSKHSTLIDAGLKWLSDNQNDDGGWGDTIRSVSNISTTMLCWSAFTVAEQSLDFETVVAAAQTWIAEFCGGISGQLLAETLDRQYGNDRSFSAPILTMCALAGKLGPDDDAWRHVKPLPFELAMLPRRLFSALRLPVVSYALPALIAIGQVGFHHRSKNDLIIGLIRRMSRKRTLKVLEQIQPENGGFLEATPLTAFVVMSLASSGQADNVVVTKGVEFLRSSVRNDGSWPIDTDLATWVTTLAINGLAAHEDFECILGAQDRSRLSAYLESSQYKTIHPYTLAAPGGWAWSNLPGAVPDADDTAGALIAMKNLGTVDDAAIASAAAGVTWLLGLQNRDGGIPTFCRGWMNLPFDRSSPDITAHTLGAFGCWLDHLPAKLKARTEKAIARAVAYLRDVQSSNGSWSPLWFGNQYAPKQANPVYGTSRVLLGLNRLDSRFHEQTSEMIHKGAEYLLSARNTDNGWGGDAGVESSIEETALAVDALADILAATPKEQLEEAVTAGAQWLTDRINRRSAFKPSPIGLYFASLWYYEDLYPLIFATAALCKVHALLED